MPDQHQIIADQLDELVQQGKAIDWRERIRSSSELQKQLEDRGQESASKSKKSASSKQRGDKAKQRKEIVKKILETPFGEDYQPWYSQALRVVEQLLPDRYQEFCELYRPQKTPKELDWVTYTISEYVHGTVVTRGWDREPVFDSTASALAKLRNQINILASAQDRLDSALVDIRGTLESTLLDDELATASELLTAKHLRSAGVVAGVVLERHLKRVIANHEVTFRKKSQIGSLNDALKEAKVYDLAQWRFVQRMGDIRNLCGHDGERNPTAEEVEDLIRGTEKVIATIF